jgi:predicted alpha/beta superfamily hydrolase
MPIDAFTATEFFEVSPGIFSRSFDGHRVDVRLPKELHEDSPVLVMQDGMNVFFSEFSSDGHTWLISEALDSGLISLDPLVIAVWGEGGLIKYNPRRINEFLCDDTFEAHPELWETLLPALTPPTREPRGNYLMDLIADSILPATLAHFGVNHSAARTSLMGCSVAGVHAIYSCIRRPDSFSAAFALSAHWEFGGIKLISQLAAGLLGLPTPPMIWSDSGDSGLDAASEPLNRYFGERLGELGFAPTSNLNVQTFANTGHNEKFWGARVEQPINWWADRLASNG